MDNKDSILIWIDSFENKNLILHGAKLAQYLNVSYCIINSSNLSKTCSFTYPNGNIIEYNNSKISQFIFDIKNDLGILFIITDVDYLNSKLTNNSIKKINNIKRTELAFICLKNDYSFRVYETIITITGYEKTEKSKVMWANYFTKKLGGITQLIVPTENDEYISSNIADTLAFSTNLFKRTKNKYHIYKSHLSTEKLKNTVNHSLLDNNSLFIVNQKILHLNPFSLPSDIKLIRDSKDKAIMIVPETDDSLIPCH